MNCWFETSIRWLLRVHLQRIVYSKHSCSYSFMIFYGPLKMKSSTNLYHRRSQFPLWIRCSHQKKSLQTNYTPSRWPLQLVARPCSWARRLGDVDFGRSVLEVCCCWCRLWCTSARAARPCTPVLVCWRVLATRRLFDSCLSTPWFGLQDFLETTRSNSTSGHGEQISFYLGDHLIIIMIYFFLDIIGWIWKNIQDEHYHFFFFVENSINSKTFRGIIKRIKVQILL